MQKKEEAYKEKVDIEILRDYDELSVLEKQSLLAVNPIVCKLHGDGTPGNMIADIIYRKVEESSIAKIKEELGTNIKSLADDVWWHLRWRFKRGQ